MLSAALREWTSRSSGPSPAAPVRVSRLQTPYWQQRGWRRQGHTYTGNYQTPYGAFQGMVEERSSGHRRFFLFDPPPAVRRHDHWVCFTPQGGGRYQVHMATMPGDVSSGILTIERLLVEAFEQQ